MSDIKLRNKHIKIADKSEGGWKVVDEYKTEETSWTIVDDEKRIKAARKAVAANARDDKKKSRQYKRSAPYFKPF